MYWEEPGGKNTERTLQRARQKIDNSELKHLVIASNTGETVEKFFELTNDLQVNVVCVTHHVGFREPGTDEMEAITRDELQQKGVDLLTTTHALAGVARSIKNDYGGLYPAEIMAETLRMFGQGVKVCVEISIMALDAGLIPFGQEIVAIGGTGRGADSACIVRPSHSNDVFSTKVREVLCRPRKTKSIN